MNDQQLIANTLDRLAERDIDITPQVYERFFALCPEAKPLFSSTASAGPHGRMLYELFQMLTGQMVQQPGEPVPMVSTAREHSAWGATAPMYPLFVEALLQSLGDALGADWTPALAEAWQRELVHLLSQMPQA